MKKYLFSNGIINIVVGGLLIIFAILGMFVFEWFSDAANIVVGAIIILVSVLRFGKHRKQYNNQNALMILTAEVIIVITLSVLLVLNRLTMTETIGIVLYLRGFVYLLILQLLKLRSTFLTFILYIIILTLGAFVFFNGPNLNDIIEWLLFIIITAYGLFMVIMGIDQLRNKPKE
ncbi:MAG: hypothetical protein ACOC1L_07830 [Bacillota bacterium]